MAENFQARETESLGAGQMERRIRRSVGHMQMRAGDLSVHRDRFRIPSNHHIRAIADGPSRLAEAINMSFIKDGSGRGTVESRYGARRQQTTKKKQTGMGFSDLAPSYTTSPSKNGKPDQQLLAAKFLTRQHRGRARTATGHAATRLPKEVVL